MSPSVRCPHRARGVIDHQVSVSLHQGETGLSAPSSAPPERRRPLVQHEVSVKLVYQPEPSIGGLAKLAGQQEVARGHAVRKSVRRTTRVDENRNIA